MWLRSGGALVYWLTSAPLYATTKSKTKDITMNTIKCGLKLNEHHTGIGTGVTPAEVLVLTAIHFPGADRGLYPVIVAPVAEGEALTIDKPDVSAQEAYELPGGRKVAEVEAQPAKTHPRTNIEEFDRLKRKYTATVDGDPKKPLVGQMFPGVNPSLPQTFEEIGLKVAAPDESTEAPQLRGQSTTGAGEIEEGHNLRPAKKSARSE